MAWTREERDHGQQREFPFQDEEPDVPSAVPTEAALDDPFLDEFREIGLAGQIEVALDVPGGVQ